MIYFPGYNLLCHMRCSWYHQICDIKRSHLFPYFIRRWETLSLSLIIKIQYISMQSLNRNFCLFPKYIWFNNLWVLPFYCGWEANLNLSIITGYLVQIYSLPIQVRTTVYFCGIFLLIKQNFWVQPYMHLAPVTLILWLKVTLQQMLNIYSGT